MAHFPAVTRDSIPQFDLYAELEVARLASVEVIEAAYRTLVKRHHPDVSRPLDADRIKRLNEAREWLTDPTRRKRYDAATRNDQPVASIPKAASSAGDLATAPGSRRSFARAFGANTAEVRQFLADLRALAEPRAREIQAGNLAANATAYEAARHAAFTIGSVERQTEWLLAREAASVIARGKVADANLRSRIVEIVADIAGAIAVRDLIAQADFDTLLLPWTWRGDPRTVLGGGRAAGAAATGAGGVAAGATGGGVAAGATAAGAAGATAAGTAGESASGSAEAGATAPLSAVRAGAPRQQPTSRRVAPRALVAVIAVIALAFSILMLNRSGPNVALADPTGTSTSGQVTAPGDSGSQEPSASIAASEPPSAGPNPSPASGPTDSAAPIPTTLLPPSAPSPKPTAVPIAATTPGPAPVPTPTPVPTPAPPVFCTVPDFANTNSANAQGTWTLASFTGTITYEPAIPPQFKIRWQSLTAGTIVSCTSNITLQRVAPTPSP